MIDHDRRNIAEMGDPEFRSYLRELYRQGDRMAAEHAAYMAERAAATQAKALTRENDAADLQHHTDTNNAPAPVPVAEAKTWCFSEEQFEALAYAMAELRRDWQADIERTQQRILQAVARCVLPGELAETELYALRNRVARAEEKIERQLKQALGDDGDDNVLDLPSFIQRRADAA